MVVIIAVPSEPRKRPKKPATELPRRGKNTISRYIISSVIRQQKIRQWRNGLWLSDRSISLEGGPIPQNVHPSPLFLWRLSTSTNERLQIACHSDWDRPAVYKVAPRTLLPWKYGGCRELALLASFYMIICTLVAALPSGNSKRVKNEWSSNQKEGLSPPQASEFASKERI